MLTHIYSFNTFIWCLLFIRVLGTEQRTNDVPVPRGLTFQRSFQIGEMRMKMLHSNVHLALQVHANSHKTVETSLTVCLRCVRTEQCHDRSHVSPSGRGTWGDVGQRAHIFSYQNTSEALRCSMETAVNNSVLNTQELLRGGRKHSHHTHKSE